MAVNITDASDRYFRRFALFASLFKGVRMIMNIKITFHKIGSNLTMNNFLKKRRVTSWLWSIRHPPTHLFNVNYLKILTHILKTDLHIVCATNFNNTPLKGNIFPLYVINQIMNSGLPVCTLYVTSGIHTDVLPSTGVNVFTLPTHPFKVY